MSQSDNSLPSDALLNRVCLVTGASRGIGRGIAVALGKCGAVVYITGRTHGGKDEKPKSNTLNATALEIQKAGGKAIPIVVDHSKDDDVSALFERIRSEQGGRLDLLVNCAFSGMAFLLRNLHSSCHQITECSPGEAWDLVNNVGLRSNYVCMIHAIRLMLDWQKSNTDATITQPGVIINMGSPGSMMYMFNGLYGTGKTANDRLVKDIDRELKRENAKVCLISLWSNEVRTEEFQSAVSAKNQTFKVNEWLNFDVQYNACSTDLVGRIVVNLVLEPMEQLMARSGQICLLSDLAKEHDVRESNGQFPVHARSLRHMLSSAGYWMSQYIPNFVLAPRWLYFYLLSNM